MKKGMIAECSLGTLGLITHDEPQEVTYKDGTKGIAFVGIHLTDKIAPIGSPWCSRNPRIKGRIENVLLISEILDNKALTLEQFYKLLHGEPDVKS